MNVTPLRIVGQGLAGSLLAWACEQNGIAFTIFDLGHATASSRVGAGIINPITGQRLVKSWRVDELLPKAVQTYRELESALGEPLLFPLRIRRFCRTEREREIARTKRARGELAPYVVSGDGQEFWIEQAYRVDLERLISRLRQRWMLSGNLVQAEVLSDAGEQKGALTVWCIGAAELKSPRFAGAKLQPAKGEILTVESENLETTVILNDGHWVLPLGSGLAKVGATFQPAFQDLEPTREARETLIASAKRLIGAEFQVVAQEVGVRVTTVDKHPVIGRHPVEHDQGIFNGLGSKGALVGPWLAAQWLTHLTTGAGFDETVDWTRFL